MKALLKTPPRLWFVKAYPTNNRKRSLKQRIRNWRRAHQKFYYKLGDQIAIF